MKADASTTICGRNILDACTASFNILSETDLDIQIASTKQLKTHQFNELRQLWRHAVHLDTNAVGWLPTSVFDSRAATDDVTAVYRDRELVGWCLRGESSARKVLKIYQIWVRPDARVLEHGRALIQDLLNIAVRDNCGWLEAWVAADLQANIFWDAIGFTRTVWRWGRGRSLRKIYLWRKMAEVVFNNTHDTTEFMGIDTYDTNQRRHTIHGGTI